MGKQFGNDLVRLDSFVIALLHPGRVVRTSELFGHPKSVAQLSNILQQ